MRLGALLQKTVGANVGWSQTLGSVGLFVLLVQVTTGVVLAQYCVPSPNQAYWVTVVWPWIMSSVPAVGLLLIRALGGLQVGGATLSRFFILHILLPPPRPPPPSAWRSPTTPSLGPPPAGRGNAGRIAASGGPARLRTAVPPPSALEKCDR